MWKDFFYFSKGQRTGIIILTILIITGMLLNHYLYIFFPEKEYTNSEFLAEVDSFKKSLVSRDSLRQIEWLKLSAERQQEYEEKYNQFESGYSKTENNKYQLFTFDPNKIDSIKLINLGLKPYVVSNILKYRKNGGEYKTASAFSKVYGISPDKFNELEPYIEISLKKDSVSLNIAENHKNIIVDLNSADTTLLMQVKGIGRGYAKGIVRFRKQTGGFVSVEQLNEVYGMRLENYEKIKAFCSVNTNLVQKIKVNISTTERLNAHPYINFYQAKAMYELRRKKGKLKVIDELKVLSEFTAESLEKISPYLSFE